MLPDPVTAVHGPPRLVERSHVQTSVESTPSRSLTVAVSSMLTRGCAESLIWPASSLFVTVTSTGNLTVWSPAWTTSVTS